MSFPKYPDYKDSGVEWLGEVPAHWAVVKLKTICHMQSGEFISSPDIHDDGPYPVYGGNGQRGFTSTYTHSGLYPIIGRQGALCGNVNYASGDFWASEHAVVVTPEPAISPVWLGELLRSMDLNQYSITAAQPGLAVEKVKNLHVPNPSPPEQKNIAAFLDHETARIDALVAEQQRLIELLKEKREAVISHAVTKGLNPDAPMKDSGVEWLGEVPAHWGVLRLKQLVSVQGGATPSKERVDFWDGDIPWASPKDMKVDRLAQTSDYITDAALLHTGLPLIKPGAVLIVVRGMILAHSVPVAINETSLTINQDMKALRPFGQLSSEFLLHLLTGIRDAVFPYIDASAHGTKKLEWERFQNILLPLPPFPEQQEICQATNERLEVVRELVATARSAIELLQERRSALISAAVTGKIDVRGWQPPPGSSPPTETTATEPA